jgi:hypothetical protein
MRSFKMGTLEWGREEGCEKVITEEQSKSTYWQVDLNLKQEK